MRSLLAVLALISLPALADEPVLRPSARLLFRQPEFTQPGSCVRYEEGGSGWIVTEPVYYLRGKVIASEVQMRHLVQCPVVPGKTLERYSRLEFNRHARAYPCLAEGVPERDEQVGIVRLKVEDWETPHARKAENAGRLYRGMFIDRELKKGMEIELEADLLAACE